MLLILEEPWMGFFLSIIVLWAGLIQANNDEKTSCLFDPKKLVKNLSTKTPYFYISSEQNRSQQLDGRINGTLQLWLIARHGTRYPSDSGLDAIKTKLQKFIQKVRENHEKGFGELCKDDVHFFSKWMEDTKESLQSEHIQEKFLHPEGEMEFINLAERFRERFPDLLPENYSSEMLKFRATKTERAIKSQLYFATGLFNRTVAQSEVQYESPIKPHDPLIRFYKTCPKWLYEVKKSPNSLAEQKLFETSEFFADNVIRPVSVRLGFQDNLTLSDIETLYVSCNFGQAWQPAKGVPACQAFNEEELKILEYREELEYYWQDGYGFDINYDSGCVLIKDIVENFESVLKGESVKKGIFYFTHSGTILKFLTFLGLFKDSEQIKSNNFHVMKDARLFRTSKIDPFGANIAFALSNDSKVGLYHNERLTLIPGCQDLWCDFEVLKSVFKDRISNCDLKVICATNVTNQDPSATADDRF